MTAPDDINHTKVIKAAKKILRIIDVRDFNDKELKTLFLTLIEVLDEKYAVERK